MSGTLDFEALIRATIGGIGGSLLVAAVAFFALRKRADWDRWRSAVVIGTIGLTLILGLGIYYVWPSLVVVPSLDGLSQAEAEDLLLKRRLVPNGKPQYAYDVEAGRVVPHSQSPSQGLSVRPATPVSYAISVRREAFPGPSKSDPGPPAVSLFQPKAGARVRCRPGPDNVFKFEVRGTSAGVVPGGPGLLVWVRPVSPPSDTPGWYLQRPPSNGINKVEEDGSWVGVAQIGNAQWPPSEGDKLDVAVTITDRDTVNQLIAEKGVVVRNQPVGLKSSDALGVVVTLR